MLRRKRMTIVARLVVASFLVMQVSACFSEHVDTTGLHEDCEIPAGVDPNTVVTLAGYDFAPDTLRVSANTTVTWVNCDSVAGRDAHTTTSDTGVWESPFFAEGETYARLFGTAGTFPYHCIPHTNMRAVIIVQ